MFYLLTFILLFVPRLIFADVVISEVAWMGGNASASDEWIELRNTDSEPVDLSGWLLSSGNGSLHVTLSGTIEGNGYFLLERSDDDTVPNVPADMLYTGSLTNAGDSLTLKNGSGAIKDSVNGGENWQAIGGDNTTKDTAQRNGSIWITAAPTPRRSNAANGSIPSNTPSANTNTAQKTTRTESKATPPSEETMQVSAGEDRSVLIRTPVTFSATTLGRDKKPITNATYIWTFGDGAAAEGQKVTHVFQSPGEYVVLVSAGNLDTRVSVSDRIIVTTNEPDFSLVLNTDSSLSLINNGEEDIDIGSLVLTGSGKQFTIPPSTIILGEGSIRFVPEVIGFRGDESSTLLYQNGLPVVGAEKSRNRSASPIVSKKETVLEKPLASAKVTVSDDEPETVTKSASSKPKKEELADSDFQQASAVLPTEGAHSSIMIWVLGLIALLGAAIGAVFVIRRIEPITEDAPVLTAADFRIIEED